MVKSLAQKTLQKTALIMAISYFPISFFCEELFPYSSATMFSFPFEKIHQIEVHSLDGTDLTKNFPSLNLFNDCDPPVTTLGRKGYGKLGLLTFHGDGFRSPYGTIADRSTLNHYIKEQMKIQKIEPQVKVMLVEWSLLNNRVIRNDRDTWVVKNDLKL